MREKAALLDRAGHPGFAARFGRVPAALVAARHDQRVWETTSDRTVSMVRDFQAALKRWPLWIRLGWQDVLLRYRRSLLGPFWLTLSMLVMIATLGNIYGQILNLPAVKYVPFLTTGLIVWTLITSMVSDGCQTYNEGEHLIRNIDLPLSMFPIRVVWRNLIIFAHHAVVYLALLLFLPIPLHWTALSAIVGIGVLLLNGLWASMLFGMLSARFRDLPQIITSLMQVAFFATPIIWSTEAINGDTMIWEANPFFHLIEIVRAPLIGMRVPRHSWLIVAMFTAGGWTLALLMFRQFHRRISYWV